VIGNATSGGLVPSGAVVYPIPEPGAAPPVTTIPAVELIRRAAMPERGAYRMVRGSTSGRLG
jgi:hypothetical protein